MQQGGAAAAASSDALDPAALKLRTFFHSKLAEFGLDDSHASWAACSSFPPPPFKNRHLELISARLGVPLRQMILLDDRDENGEAALEAGAWALFLAPPKKGLQVHDLSGDNVLAPDGCSKVMPAAAADATRPATNSDAPTS